MYARDGTVRQRREGRYFTVLCLHREKREKMREPRNEVELWYGKKEEI